MSLAYRFVVVLTCSIVVAAAAAQPSSPTVLWEQPLRVLQTSSADRKERLTG